ncbi:MAG TPA: peptidase [Flavobacteriaceae bacterium]|nr:peptidase [Flavobacteriaceae bacterium]
MYHYKKTVFPLETKLMGIFISLLFLIASCNTTVNTETENLARQKRLETKSIEALKYCTANNFDTTYCILIDMSIHSGKFRFFVWDFSKNQILDEGLCSHGSCGNIDIPKGEELPYFSNQPGSYCSSLGKYKIGKRGVSSFGINVNYKLHGLEATNNNAFDRIIVLHSFTDLENYEVYPDNIIESWGCPSISDDYLRRVDTKLSNTDKSVLMWIFN